MKIEVHKSDESGDILTLLEPLEINWNGRGLIVPAGFKSDGASVPEFLWSTVSPAIDPRTVRGAVAHDYVYRHHPEGWTRADADNMFYDLIREDGLGWWRAQKCYWGVRLFGGKAWEEGGNGYAQQALKNGFAPEYSPDADLSKV